MMKPLLWVDLTWQDVRDMRAEGVDCALLPVGSTEQHGPHLPLNTSTFLCETLAHAVSARTGVPVLPTLCFGGAPGGSRAWPGNIGLSSLTLAGVVSDVLHTLVAQGFTRLLIISGAPSSEVGLRLAIEQAQSEAGAPIPQIALRGLLEVSPRVALASQAEGARGARSHGGAAHTALMLHLAPGKVRREKISDDPDRVGETVFGYAPGDRSHEGHLGNPLLATPEMGAELFEALVTDWTYLVKRGLVEEPPTPADPNALPQRRPSSHAHREPPPEYKFGQLAAPPSTSGASAEPPQAPEDAARLFRAPQDAARN